MTLSPESDVSERQATGPAVNPEAEDSLIGFPKLSGPRHDPATIDPDRKSEGSPILQGEHLGGSLGGAIEGKWGLGGELLCKP
jgi:hypothetical protein